MIKAIDNAKSNGDSVGGIFQVIATGLPYGLGSPMQWDSKLQAKISGMMMSVNAFAGIEIGSGFNKAEKLGSQVHDEIGWGDEKYIRYSNNARYSTSGSTGDTIFTPNQIEGTYSTGTLIQSANTVSSAKTKVGGTILYKDSSGTAGRLLPDRSCMTKPVFGQSGPSNALKY